MKQLFLVVALVLSGCGRFEPVQEPAEVPLQPPASLPPPATRCVVGPDSTSSRWECETVSALEIVSLKVTNTDGSAPWSTGQPRVTSVMRNVTGQFLNYPGVQIGASAAALQPSYPRDSLYGMLGCAQAEMSMQFVGSAAKGSSVTFTAIPTHINGDQCPLAKPPVTLTVTVP